MKKSYSIFKKNTFNFNCRSQIKGKKYSKSIKLIFVGETHGACLDSSKCWWRWISLQFEFGFVGFEEVVAFVAWTILIFCSDWNCCNCSWVKTICFPVEDCTMNWEPDEAAAVVAGCCLTMPPVWLLWARMYCLPPIDTMEEGVAVTVDGVIPDAELTTILQKI